MEFDYDRLRSDLLDYFGAAISYNQLAIFYLGKVQSATDSELLVYAREFGFDLNNYVKGNSYKYSL